VPLAVALLLTFLLAPLVHRLERRHVPRTLAVLTIVALSFALLGGIGWLISIQAKDLAIKLGDYQGDIERKISHMQQAFGHGALAKATQTIDQMAKDVATSRPVENGNTANWLTRGTPDNPLAVQVTSGSTTGSTFESIVSAFEFLLPMAQAIVVIVLVIFMLMEREEIRNRIIRLVGYGQLTATTQALDDAATRISRYLIAQSGINGVYGIVVGTALYFIHVPNAPLWGLLCALLRFIPYLGIWVGAVFPLILSFVVPEGYYPARPLLTIGLFVVVELIAANGVEPLLFGSSTGVSPLAILISAVFWTWLWGPVGLLLSTPLTVLLDVAGKYVPKLAFLDVLLGDQPVLTPPERYYQRLLAEDAEEAEELVEEFEKTHSIEELYTHLILPVLEMAKQDHQRGELDEERREFINQVIREHVEAHSPEPTESAAKNCPVTVVCLPADDLADEIAAMMLANLARERAFCVSCVSAEMLASERVGVIAGSKTDLVVISAMPPGAASHARYLCKKIRTKFPKIQMIIGLWNATGDVAKIKRRLACDADSRVTIRLREAVDLIHQMVQPLLIQASNDEKSETQPPPNNPTGPADFSRQDPLPQTSRSD